MLWTVGGVVLLALACAELVRLIRKRRAMEAEATESG